MEKLNNVKVSYIFVLVFLLVFLVVYRVINFTSDAVFISNGESAKWIMPDQSFSHLTYLPYDVSEVFYKKFVINSKDRNELDLSIWTLSSAKLYFGSKLVFDTRQKNNEVPWRDEMRIKIPDLNVGEYELFVVVENSNGPLMLKIESNNASINTDSTWKVLTNNRTLSPIITLGSDKERSVENKYSDVQKAFFSTLPYGICIFLLVAFCYLIIKNSHYCWVEVNHILR